MSSAAASVTFGAGVPTSARARAWQRFRGDWVALVAGAYVLFVLLACFVAEPIAERLLGHGPNDLFPGSVGDNLKPVGPWSHVPVLDYAGAQVTPSTPRTLFIFGADGTLGHDEFLRLLAGGRTSLLVALGATAIAVFVGTLVGCLAGFYGGWVDGTLSRLTEFVMGFPILFFVVVFGLTAADRLNKIRAGNVIVPGVVTLVVLIGLFSWFYIARIVRAQVISLREQEFIEAARMIGGGGFYIARKHIVPHLVGTLVVYGSLVVAATIVLEAALSLLNVGIALPHASWGNMLSTNWGTLLVPGGPEPYVERSAWTSIFPTVAVFTTTFAFALLGEGLRRAFDPYGTT